MVVVRVTVCTVVVVCPPPKIVVFLGPLATEPPNTSSDPVRKNAAIAKPMTPVTSPSTSHVRPRERAPALVLLPQAERVVAALARGRRDVVRAVRGQLAAAVARRARGWSTGRRSASPTMPTMTGVTAAPTIAPPPHTSWTTSAAASDDRLAMMSVWKEMPGAGPGLSRGAVLT